MAEVEGYLTVTYIIGVDVDSKPGPDDALELLERAYEDGELGVLDSHEWLEVIVDGETVWKAEETEPEWGQHVES